MKKVSDSLLQKGHNSGEVMTLLPDEVSMTLCLHQNPRNEKEILLLSGYEGRAKVSRKS